MNMEKKAEQLEALLQTKDFEALTPDERGLVLESMTESEYIGMRNLHRELERESPAILHPRSETLPQLVEFMKNSRRSPRLNRSLYQSVAIWKLAAIMIPLCALMWLWGYRSSPVKWETKFIAGATDTLYLKLPSDTVVVPKIVYRYQVQASATTVPAQQVPGVQTSKEQDGISMKEKEDLNALLVSGRD
jgi:hypothetical protein